MWLYDSNFVVVIGKKMANLLPFSLVHLKIVLSIY